MVSLEGLTQRTGCQHPTVARLREEVTSSGVIVSEMFFYKEGERNVVAGEGSELRENVSG